VAVHLANIQDRDGTKLVLRRLLGHFPHLERPWAAGAYAGKLVEWARRTGGWKLELVRRLAQQHTFQVLPCRWVVERTFAWLGLQRRLSKDSEALPATNEAWVYTAVAGLMLRRSARSPTP
jgi:transposase